MQPVIIAKIKYNDRDTVLKLPCKDSQWWAQREQLTEDEDATFYLSAVEPPGLAPLVGLEVNLDELNFLAKSMDRFTDSEEAQFLGALQIAKSPTLRDAINLSFNLERFTVVQNVANLAHVGRDHYMNLHGGTVPSEISNAEFVQMGRQLLASGKGIPTDHGLLFENGEVPMQQIYDGTTFPCYLSRSDVVALCTVEYCGKTEYLYLPEEEISVNMALGRLCAPSLEECKIEVESAQTVHREWADWFEGILEHEGLDVLNFLCETLSKERLDWDKLTAVVRYADVVCGEDIEKLARHLDDFVFIKGGSGLTDADIGEYFTDHDYRYSAPPGLRDFIDFDALGKYLRDDLDGEFVAGGFVCMENGCSLQHILGETQQGMTMGGYQ